jgi:hypothetical protein
MRANMAELEANGQNPDFVDLCVPKRKKQEKKSAAFLQHACLSLPPQKGSQWLRTCIRDRSYMRLGGLLDKRVNVGLRC